MLNARQYDEYILCLLLFCFLFYFSVSFLPSTLFLPPFPPTPNFDCILTSILSSAFPDERSDTSFTHHGWPWPAEAFSVLYALRVIILYVNGGGPLNF